MTRELARLEGVGKLYPRVHKPGERLRAFAQILAGREPSEGARVLHDINLVVRQGESLGIIGENGAGKSTLLKVLTGVIQPSRGRVQLNARHAALLELGAGFQPDFSGLDNIRMKAALLGMGSAGLRRKLDQILEFADIGDYIHEPVKHYSSGMVVRLGFAVVAASEPELLITDEVLAVGDESFQRKCIAWIEQFLAEGGTLLFVSHAMYLVQKLCRHALWLQAGEARALGDAFSVSQEYLSWHESRLAEQRRANSREQGSAASYGVESLSLDGPGPDASLPMGADLTVEMVLLSPDGRPPVGLFGVVRLDGTPVYGLGSEAAGVQPTRLGENRYRYRLRFNQLSLLPGSYSIRGHAMDPEGLRVCDTQELTVRVVGASRELGIVRLAHEWLD